jgi:hypothetical protein
MCHAMLEDGKSAGSIQLYKIPIEVGLFNG